MAAAITSVIQTLRTCSLYLLQTTNGIYSRFAQATANERAITCAHDRTNKKNTWVSTVFIFLGYFRNIIRKNCLNDVCTTHQVRDRYRHHLWQNPLEWHTSRKTLTSMLFWISAWVVNFYLYMIIVNLTFSNLSPASAHKTTSSEYFD